MDSFFETFSSAFGRFNGYDLAATLSPLSPPSEPDRLYRFYRSTNIQSVSSDFKYRLLYDKSNPLRLGADEGNGWVEIYIAYWKAIGEILEAESAMKENRKVELLF